MNQGLTFRLGHFEFPGPAEVLSFPAQCGASSPLDLPFLWEIGADFEFAPQTWPEALCLSALGPFEPLRTGSGPSPHFTQSAASARISI